MIEPNIKEQIEKVIKKALKDIDSVKIQQRTKLLNNLVALYEKIGGEEKKERVYHINIVDHLLGIQYFRDFTIKGDRAKITYSKDYDAKKDRYINNKEE